MRLVGIRSNPLLSRVDEAAEIAAWLDWAGQSTELPERRAAGRQLALFD